MSTASGGVIQDNVLNNLFANVSGPDSTTGVTHFRGIYLENANTSLELLNAKIYIEQPTTSTDDEVQIAIAQQDVGVQMAQIPGQTTPPSSVSFSHPTTEAQALTIGNVPAESFRGVWVRRVVNAGAAAFSDNSFALRVIGETLG